jgi:alpha-glucosidase
MNYSGFATPVLEWLQGVVHGSHARGIVLRTDRSSTRDMVTTLDAFRSAVPWAVADCQFNLLDSHDTARVRTAVGGDPGLVRAAIGLLMTYVGVPSILYGDEIGLEGHDGLSTRRTMPWGAGSWDQEHLAFVRGLVRRRVASRALHSGGFQVLEVAGDSLAFLRDTADEMAVVVVARGPDPRPAAPVPVAHGAVPDGMGFVELLTGARSTVVGGHLPVGPMPPGVAIWASPGP